MLQLFLSLPVFVMSYFKDETISGYVDPGTAFFLQEISGQPYPGDTTITFPEQGRVSGKAACNSYFASQFVPMPWFQLGPIASTRSTCPDMALEQEYFETLSRMTLIESFAGVVILSNENGEELVFRAAQD